MGVWEQRREKPWRASGRSRRGGATNRGGSRRRRRRARPATRRGPWAKMGSGGCPGPAESGRRRPPLRQRRRVAYRGRNPFVINLAEVVFRAGSGFPGTGVGEVWSPPVIHRLTTGTERDGIPLPGYFSYPPLLLAQNSLGGSRRDGARF